MVQVVVKLPVALVVPEQPASVPEVVARVMDIPLNAVFEESLTVTVHVELAELPVGIVGPVGEQLNVE